MGSDEYPDEVNIRGYKPSEGVHSGQLKKALAELNNAKKPVFLIGGGVNIAHARKEMQELCELTYRRSGCYDDYGEKVRFQPTIRFMLEILVCMEILHRIRRLWNATCCFPLEPDLTTVLQER